jgi:hypothetical protein
VQYFAVNYTIRYSLDISQDSCQSDTETAPGHV